MIDNFYSEFEKRHRGSRELIKNRLQVYNEFIMPLIELYPNSNALDLGCGRGEWLEVATKIGFKAKGIDLDDGMLSYCVDLELNVEKKGLIEYLSIMEDDSLSLITSFHVIEHIGVENVKILIKEAHRILKPGGLLILETPNPENIMVGTNNFYIDPTHIAPIPHQLLDFLMEYNGFFRRKVVRLQEAEMLSAENNLQFKDIFFGVSPDYSIVAQKIASDDFLNKFDSIFSKNFGVDLITVVNKYNDVINNVIKVNTAKIESLENTFNNKFKNEYSEPKIKMDDLNRISKEQQQKLLTSNQQLHASEKKFASLQTDYAAAKTKIDELNHSSHHWWMVADELNRELQSVYASKSWKITKPLRLISLTVNRCAHFLFGYFREENSHSWRLKPRLPIVKKLYYSLSAINPKLADKLKGKFHAHTILTAVKNTTVVPPQEKNFVSHYQLVSTINHRNAMDSDRYLNYVAEIFKSAGMLTFWQNLPADTEFWVKKILQAQYLGQPIDLLFKEDISVPAAATALYIALLGRLPENETVTLPPIKKLCHAILRSQEYKKIHGESLAVWSQK